MQGQTLRMSRLALLQQGPVQLEHEMHMGLGFVNVGYAVAGAAHGALAGIPGRQGGVDAAKAAQQRIQDYAQNNSGPVPTQADYEALGLTMDGSGFGLGKRGQRFSMVVNDGTVEQLHVEAPGEFKVSSAEYMLEQL